MIIRIKDDLLKCNRCSLPGEQIPSTELLADKAVYSSADSIVTLSSTGLLQSFGILGHALLIIISTDANGLKQRLNIVVEASERIDRKARKYFLNAKF